MPDIKKDTFKNFSKNFIPKKYLKNKKDPYFFRNHKIKDFPTRALTAKEIELLIKNNNFAENWNNILVSFEFDPSLIKNCDLYGKIKIGKLTKSYLIKNDLKLPVGLYNSTIISCVIGNNVSIKQVNYLSHYIIDDECILFNINEMITSSNAKFGNGILKEGENESARIWLEICNENKGRKILPFDSLIPADAYIWSKYRNDKKLLNKLQKITDKSYDSKRGYYGTVGAFTVIKNSKILKNVAIGQNAYIKGANKLKNLTIHSSIDEPSQIGEGVELVNGIIGYGSKIFYGSKAVRFVTGRNTQLKYGARLINSVLGDNSTVSCCELLNNLIFPFHEQHHNNSFLIASTLMGQSNIAAGATIGSNHNSRGPDGELVAGRGFWPGLCTNFKHNSKFASFVLISKGSFQYELNIQYPFSLVLFNENESPIKIMPGYWFEYNMYAIARNDYKFKERDKRSIKTQNIEIAHLAPDTVSEMLSAINKIKYLIGKKISLDNKQKVKDEDCLIIADKYINEINSNDIHLLDIEAMNRYGAVIVKPVSGINEYQKMCIYFAINTIFQYFKFDKNSDIPLLKQKITALLNKKLYTSWTNIGGQLMPEEKLNILFSDIKKNKLKSWDNIHNEYNVIFNEYPEQKTRYAIYVLETIYKKQIILFSEENWKDLIKKVIFISNEIIDRAYQSKIKDYKSNFRKITYNNTKEMDAVLGNIKKNTFLIELKKDITANIAIYSNMINNK